MLKRNNRKGFTLAELLIVVAIIAILVAIAVPLFVNALNDAEKQVYASNKRAVKSAAVVYVLEKGLDISAVDDTNNFLLATATLTTDGDIKSVTVAVKKSTEDHAGDEFSDWKTAKSGATAGEYTMKVLLSVTDFS